MTPQAPEQPTPDYDFIMASSQPTKQRFNISGGSKKNRIVVVIVGIVLAFIILMIFLYIVGAPKRTENAQMKTLAAVQTEMTRVATLGTDAAGAESTRNTAQTAAMTLTTDLSQTQSLMKRRGITVSAAELLSLKSPSTDKALEDAKKSNTFDQEFKKLWAEKIANYQAILKQVYSTQSGTITKQSVNDYFNHATLLVFDYEPKAN